MVIIITINVVHEVQNKYKHKRKAKRKAKKYRKAKKNMTVTTSLYAQMIYGRTNVIFLQDWIFNRQKVIFLQYSVIFLQEPPNGGVEYKGYEEMAIFEQYIALSQKQYKMEGK